MRADITYTQLTIIVCAAVTLTVVEWRYRVHCLDMNHYYMDGVSCEEGQGCYR